MQQTALQIGGLTVLTQWTGDHSMDWSRAMGDFQISTNGVGTAVDFRLQLHAQETLTPQNDFDLVFDSGALWQMRQQNSNSDVYALEIHNQAEDCKGLQWQLIFDLKTRTGDLHYRPNAQGLGQGYHPFIYPVDELFWIQLLAENKGIILHAVGVQHFQKGAFGFCGVSGAGKSTLGRLFQGHMPELNLLSDDRVIVRDQGDSLMAYGTPWHGEHAVWLPQHAPLRALFVLEHGTENCIEPLATMEAFTRLLVRSFPPFYRADALEKSLDVLAKITQDIPVYRFAFRPDASAVEYFQKEFL